MQESYRNIPFTVQLKIKIMEWALHEGIELSSNQIKRLTTNLLHVGIMPNKQTYDRRKYG